MFKVGRKYLWPTAGAFAGVAALLGAYLVYDDRRALRRYNVPHQTMIPPPVSPPRSRAEILRSLASDKEYDILVVGGGASGAGVAWDAITRGYKVAMVEREDFGAATSSRSTKLVHGGVRYLEKAFWQLDYGQYKLVKEALAERRHFLDMAPHLAFPLPIMIPVYRWWQLPYYYIGVKAYDAIAGRANLEPAYSMSRTRALQLFPMLNESELKGAIVYYDGSHNDSRTNASLAVSAVEAGADILNHCEVVSLVKNDKGRVCGAEVVDKEDPNGEHFTIKAKGVVNATGPFTDFVRKFDNKDAKDIGIASGGVHIVLPGWYCPKNIGLLDAATSDGRVVFFLPWQGSTIAGTTDHPCKVEANPTPSEEDIQFVLNEVRHYIDGKLDVTRDDVRAAWSGIRPLVRDPAAVDTQNVVRNHLIEVSSSGLVTIAGGKWTTFREMAEQTVDKCITEFSLPPRACQTKHLKLVGAADWTRLTYIDLIREFGIEPVAARHLSENYGTRCFDVARLCVPTALDSDGRIVQRNARLSPLYPFLDGEVLYAMKYEYATTAMDVLARRTRLAYLDAQAARDALPGVIDVMAAHLGWGMERQQEEYAIGLQYLIGMGLEPIPAKPTPTSNSTLAVVPAVQGSGTSAADSRQ